MHDFWGSGFSDMMNFGGGFTLWVIVYQIVKLVVFVIVVIVAIRVFANRSNNQNVMKSNRAIEILEERYALGEISEEEFKDKLKHLKE